MRCEGDFGCSCIHTFKSKKHKLKYKSIFCNTFDFEKCSLYQSVIATYKQNQKEMPGTFAEDTLVEYRKNKY